MKIGIYNEAQGSTFGGSERCVAVLAEALSQCHEVEIIHHVKATVDADEFGSHYGTNLSKVKLRYVAPEPYFISWSYNLRRRYLDARRWHACLSEPYDLFINITHGLPPFCHASKGALLVLFPWFDRHRTPPWQTDGLDVRKRLRRFYYDWEWSKRFEGYQVKTVISRYTQTWAKRWWDIDCQIVYPPTDGNFRAAVKTDTLLSVGRFATGGHTKKQSQMVSTFRQMQDTELAGWEYFCVGGLDTSAEDKAYFESVRRMASEERTHVLANIERIKLRSLYEQAKIFWHAAGYGEPVDASPTLAEHFGIVTVEAMAAGCVPIVVNKGGQAEIVQHGVSGFLWDTLEELKGYTALVAHDEQTRTQMSASARHRAQFFSRGEFLNRFLNLLQPLLQ